MKVYGPGSSYTYLEGSHGCDRCNWCHKDNVGTPAGSPFPHKKDCPSLTIKALADALAESEASREEPAPTLQQAGAEPPLKMSEVTVGMRLRDSDDYYFQQSGVLTVTEITPRGFKYDAERGYSLGARHGFVEAKGREHFGVEGICRHVRAEPPTIETARRYMEQAIWHAEQIQTGHPPDLNAMSIKGLLTHALDWLRAEPVAAPSPPSPSFTATKGDVAVMLRYAQRALADIRETQGGTIGIWFTEPMLVALCERLGGQVQASPSFTAEEVASRLTALQSTWRAIANDARPHADDDVDMVVSARDGTYAETLDRCADELDAILVDLQELKP